MRWVIVFIALTIGFFGCKKNKEKPKMTIIGSVKDYVDNSGVAGTIKLYYKPYVNGVFTSTYSSTPLAVANVDASGSYSFESEKPATSDFKFVFESANYFTVEKIINPDNLSLENTNTLNYTVNSSGYVQFHFKNNTPYDSADFFQFQTFGLNYACATCCTNSLIEKYGVLVDTSYSCIRYAKQYLRYNYYVTKNGSTSYVYDSVYCPQGVTTTLEILY